MKRDTDLSVTYGRWPDCVIPSPPCCPPATVEWLVAHGATTARLVAPVRRFATVD
jgi:hypothetical protein